MWLRLDAVEIGDEMLAWRSGEQLVRLSAADDQPDEHEDDEDDEEEEDEDEEDEEDDEDEDEDKQEDEGLDPDELNLALSC